jgi:hypothetical protein
MLSSINGCFIHELVNGHDETVMGQLEPPHKLMSIWPYLSIEMFLSETAPVGHGKNHRPDRIPDSCRFPAGAILSVE